MRRWTVHLMCVVAVMVLSALICQASMRRPGKYCGVVIFDRWDGCTLYSGIYVMYVSEQVKEGLRPYAGQAVQIDAKEVVQPDTRGDGRIGKFEYVGAAPDGREWVSLEGLGLLSSVRLDQDGKPIATILIENGGSKAVRLFSQELALTLLTRRMSSDRPGWWVSDGPSYALVTRQSFEIGSAEPRWEGKGIVAGKRYAWSIGQQNALPHEFTLGPKERKQIDVRFELPDGEYDFLCGYGGGVHGTRCVASNLSAFDVKEGRGQSVEVKGRRTADERR